MSKHLVIGIDPGKDTGFAVYDRDKKKLTALKTVTFWEAYEYFSIHARGQEKTIFRVIIEVPNTNAVWGDKARRYNVGRVNREAELLADGIARLGYAVDRQHPKGKITARRFKQITGWEGRTNKHTRDAGMLCFGYYHRHNERVSDERSKNFTSPNKTKMVRHD